MLKSSLCVLNRHNSYENNECSKDPGGYFIINGNERVIIAHEKLKPNQPYLFYKPKKIVVEVRSKAKTNKTHLITIEKNNDSRQIFLILQAIRDANIPIGIVLAACGIHNPEDIKKMIAIPEHLVEKTKDIVGNVILENRIYKKASDAIQFISTKITGVQGQQARYNHVCMILSTSLFPHLGSNRFKKALYICMILRKIILANLSKNKKDDDRDNLLNKRIETTGRLFYELLKSLMVLYKKSVSKILIKQTNVETGLSKIHILSKRLRYSMSTGNWGTIKNSSSMRTGVSQILSRLSWIAMISHLKKVVTPTGRQGKVTKLRQLHVSSWGYICPSETPEGISCGIIKNFSVMTHISEETPDSLIINYLNEFDILPSTKILDDYKCKVSVIVNGNVVGFIEKNDTAKMLNYLKKGREVDILHSDTSFGYNFKKEEIKLYSDSGRCMRPLLVVKDGKLSITSEDIKKGWNHCIKKKLIVYIDSNEENWSYITTLKLLPSRKDANYCEIDPYLIMGDIAATIPLPDYNQAPRNAYQTNMGKQAMGIFATNYNQRFDTSVNVLCYPQKQLMPTEYSEISGHSNMASGFNAIVAIMPYLGYGQEDAIILNRASVDRGMGHSVIFKTLTTSEEKAGSIKIQTIQIPPLEVRKKSLNYAYLGEDGIVKKNVYVKEGCVVVGKTSFNNKTNTTADCSLSIKKGEEGYVDKIFKGKNVYGFTIIKIRIRDMRIPEVGDKFASMAAQKGTVGMIIPQEDMPFNSQGISPDIIVNPAYLPTRMTLSQPLTSLAGKITAAGGKKRHSTAFRGVDINEMNDELKKLGLESMGEEVLMSGITGKPLKAKIFIGPIQFQRLKHMVKDKIHSRNRGPYTSLCRQPLSGRSKAGGLRIGYMEKDCIIGHGCPSFLQDRMFFSSDKFSVDVCNTCGTFISGKNKTCSACPTSEVYNTNLPYACKLLFQDLQSVGIKLKIQPKLIT
jgi:DNA-directed RNA polymerase II subunit RPB2